MFYNLDSDKAMVWDKDVSVKWEKEGKPVQESNLARSYRRNVEEFVLRLAKDKS